MVTKNEVIVLDYYKNGAFMNNSIIIETKHLVQMNLIDEIFSNDPNHLFEYKTNDIGNSIISLSRYNRYIKIYNIKLKFKLYILNRAKSLWRKIWQMKLNR